MINGNTPADGIIFSYTTTELVSVITEFMTDYLFDGITRYVPTTDEIAIFNSTARLIYNYFITGDTSAYDYLDNLLYLYSDNPYSGEFDSALWLIFEKLDTPENRIAYLGHELLDHFDSDAHHLYLDYSNDVIHVFVTPNELPEEYGLELVHVS